MEHSEGVMPDPQPAPDLGSASEPASPPEPPSQPMEPVGAAERIPVIDVLRGAALLGIITANMRGFFGPSSVYFTPSVYWTGMADRIVQSFVQCFVQGKFITIFAALFGLGFAIQMERAEGRGQGRGFYVRRMLVLLLFGAAHSFLLWWGDILMPYAVAGLLLLLFRRRRQITILRWGMGLYWFLLVPMIGAAIATLAGADLTGGMQGESAAKISEAVRVYSEGSWIEIFSTRAREWASLNAAFPVFLPNVLGTFLFGLYLWRKGVLPDVEAHLGWWRQARFVGLTLGLSLSAAFVIVDWFARINPMSMSPLAVGMMALSLVGAPCLSLFYVSSLVILHQNQRWRPRLEPFSCVGRMALTNYLLQSLVCTTVFYSYGAALYGKVSPWQGFLPGLLIYAAQVWFSRWWLARHRYGPMEWLWRKLTYGPWPHPAAPPQTQAEPAA